MKLSQSTSKSSFPKHVAISASAGSGKTYQLAHRYIRLLLSGVSPARICALTFSRKASQEIFDEIIKHLVVASQSEKDTQEMSKRMGGMPCCVADFLGCLRKIVSHLNRLHIGTLDSFIIGIARAFPSELGINMGFQIVNDEGASGQALRRAVIDRTFSSCTAPLHIQGDFLKAFKQATFGTAEKQISSSLEKFVQNYWNRYLFIQDKSAWGNALQHGL